MATPLTIPDVASLAELEGRDLGKTEWCTVDQKQIDAFAAATGDRQWIHVDPERAKRESPFGTTIAHGYLTIALAPALLPDLMVVENCSRIVNYGIEKLRLSTRSYHKLLKLARTIADLAAAETVNETHIAEAISYRRQGRRQA